MPEEKKTVELNDEELEEVSGGGRHYDTCPQNFTACGPACADCPNYLQYEDIGHYCPVTLTEYFGGIGTARH